MSQSTASQARIPTSPRLDLDRVPGPEPMPLVGAFGNLARAWLTPLDFFDTLAYGGYGNVVSFSRGMPRGIVRPAHQSPGAVFVHGPLLMHQVLHKRVEANFAETVVGGFPAEWHSAARLNNSLIWMHGEPHRRRRKVVTPLYHQRAITGYRDCLVSLIGAALDELAIDGTVDVMDWTGRILVAFQSQAVLGTSTMPGDVPQVPEQMGRLLHSMFNPLAHLGPPLRFTPRGRAKEIASCVAENLASLVTIKRRLDDGPRDVVAMLIDSRYEDGSRLSDSDLIAEIFGLFLGGWGSSRTSVAWTALLLAQHPKVAADLYDEVHSLLQGAAPTVEQLRSLPLLDGVIKESLRLMPPFPLLTRFVTGDVELGGYRLPRNTEVWLSVHHTQRDRDVYAEPSRFRPGRWASFDPSPYEYLPFGVGARTCPGAALANLQMKILIAMLVQRYRLETPRNMKVSRGGIGIAYPTPDVRMIVRKQDRCFAKSKRTLHGNIRRLVTLDA